MNNASEKCLNMAIYNTLAHQKSEMKKCKNSLFYYVLRRFFTKFKAVLRVKITTIELQIVR